MATLAEYLNPGRAQQDDFGKLAESPLEVLRGVSEGDAALLERALGVRTIRDLAEHPLVRAAQAITLLAGGNLRPEDSSEALYRQRLHELGLVAPVERNGTPPPQADRTPIEIQGQPLSETILEERR